MKNIVIKEHGEAFVSFQDIAEFSGNKYESVKRLVQNNSKEFLELKLRLPKEYDFKSVQLNEEQATFLLMLMKNNEIVTRFKLDLVKQFYKMREKIVNELCGVHEKKEIKFIEKIEHQKELIKQNKQYAKVRGFGFETAHRIISIQEADISTSDFNKLLLKEGLIKGEERTVIDYLPTGEASLGDLGAVVVHVDSAVMVLDKYNIPQKVDAQQRFDF